MSKAETPLNAVATLHLTVSLGTRDNPMNMADILAHARDIADKARELAHVDGFLEWHRADRIDVSEL